MKDNSIEMNLKSLEPLYVEGKWAELIDSLNNMKAELPTGLYHYNLGTALIGRGDVGAGRYHLEVAMREGFYNNLVINNINTVKQGLPQVYESKMSHYFWKAIEVPKDFYYASSLVLLSALLIYIFRKKTITKLRLFSFLTLITIPSLFAFFGVSRFEQAIALTEVAVHEGPSKIYKQKNSIVPGMKIMVERKTDNWFFVKHPEVYAGWVDKEMLGLLD
jgi:hypothetical protein